MSKFNPLKKFKEWYERRHRIWKGALWIIGVISGFFLWLVLLIVSYYYSGTPMAWMASVAFLIIGFITLFIIYKASERRTGIMRRVFDFFWVLPGLFWVIVSIILIILYWQIFLIFFLPFGIGFALWKLRKHEVRAKLAGYRSWAIKITHFFGTSIVMAFIFSGLTGASIKEFFVLLGLGAFLVILIVLIIVILIVAPEASLEGIASGVQSFLSGETVVNGGFIQFVGECCMGLLLWLLIGGVAFVTWKSGRKIWELKKRKEALAWELEDQLKELKEQLSEGVIAQEEYEQKRKKLLEGLTDLKELDRDVIHPMEREQKKLLDFEVAYEYRETLQSQLRELDEQLYYCAITEEEYEQKKKELLEKSEA